MRELGTETDTNSLEKSDVNNSKNNNVTSLMKEFII